jgi:hypothetical protein
MIEGKGELHGPSDRARGERQCALSNCAPLVRTIQGLEDPGEPRQAGQHSHLLRGAAAETHARGVCVQVTLLHSCSPGQ